MAEQKTNQPAPRRRIVPVAVVPQDQATPSAFDVEQPLRLPPAPSHGSTKDISACGQGRRVWVDIQNTIAVKFKEVLRQQGLEYATWKRGVDQRRAQLDGGPQAAETKRQGLSGQLYQRVQGLYEVSDSQGEGDQDDGDEEEQTGSEQGADGAGPAAGEGDEGDGGGGSSGEHDEEDEEDDEEEDKEGNETGGEIDLDKEDEAEQARGRSKPKRQRFERYDDDFIDDSELEMVKGAAQAVKTKFSGFYVSQGNVETLEEPAKPRSKPRPRAPKPDAAAGAAGAKGAAAAAAAGGGGASRKRKQPQQQQQEQQQQPEAGGGGEAPKKKRQRSETPAAPAQDKPPAGKKANSSAAPPAAPQQPAAAGPTAAGAAGAAPVPDAPAAAAAAANETGAASAAAGGIAAKALAAGLAAAKNKKALAGSSSKPAPAAAGTAAAAAPAAKSPAAAAGGTEGANGGEQQQGTSAAAAAGKPPPAPEASASAAAPPRPGAGASAAAAAAAAAAAIEAQAAAGGAAAQAAAAGLPAQIVAGVTALQRAVEEHKPPAPGTLSGSAVPNKTVRHALDAIGYSFAHLPANLQEQHSGALLGVLGPLMLPYMKEKKLKKLLFEEPARKLAEVSQARAVLLEELEQQVAGQAAAGSSAAGGAASDEDFQAQLSPAAEEALVTAWNAAAPVADQLQQLAAEVCTKLGWTHLQGQPEKAVSELKQVFNKAKKRVTKRTGSAAGGSQGTAAAVLQRQGSASVAGWGLESVPSGTVSRQSPAPEAAAAAAGGGGSQARGSTPPASTLGTTPQKQQGQAGAAGLHLVCTALAGQASAASAAAGGGAASQKHEEKFSKIQAPSPRLQRCLDAAVAAGAKREWLLEKYPTLRSQHMHQVFRTLCLCGPGGCTVRDLVGRAAQAELGFNWEDNTTTRTALKSSLQSVTMTHIAGTTEPDPKAYALLCFEGVQEQKQKQKQPRAAADVGAAPGGLQATAE